MNASTAPAARKAALAFIFITVLIDILSFGVIIPVLPGLVRQFTGGDFAQAAWWVGTFGMLFAAIQFVCTPIQGALSDRFGRRPVILLSCLGLGIDFVLMALAQSLPWLLVARIFSGVFSASFTTANAYIADGEALGTLINDDSPALSISDASLTEGHSGTQMMTFTVTLNAPSASPVYVDYSTDDDTAAMDSDYLEATDTLSFPPGVTSQTLDVPVLGDTLPELNETFVVRLSRPVNATLADDQGLGTIVNDD